MGEQMRVRFLLNNANSRILYMEAGKDLVDMLFAFLQLPVATILSIFSDNGTPLKVASISSIYESLQKLSSASLVVSKDAITHPPCIFELRKTSPQLLLPAAPDSPTLPSTVFRCNACGRMDFVSWVSGENCPHTGCKKPSSMKVSVSLAGAPPPAFRPTATPAKGYVQHYLSFIVTDDLSILPASTIESFVLLGRLNVEKISDLDSFESSVTANEALELLKVSFTSKEALNTVFHSKIPARSKKSSP